MVNSVIDRVCSSVWRGSRRPRFRLRLEVQTDFERRFGKFKNELFECFPTLKIRLFIALARFQYNNSSAAYVSASEDIVTIAVLSILVTAPLGAFLIKLLAPRLISEKEDKNNGVNNNKTSAECGVPLGSLGTIRSPSPISMLIPDEFLCSGSDDDKYIRKYDNI